VDWDRNRITYWEEKKDNWRYDVPFEPFLINGRNCPSLRWYVDNVRPMVDTGQSDALFLAPNGQKWVHGTFGQRMSKAGKRVWDKFVPYCTRHFVAVQYLIANDYNVYATAKRLGDTTATVERYYLPHAEAQSGLDRRFSMPRLMGGGE
jgi:integrase